AVAGPCRLGLTPYRLPLIRGIHALRPIDHLLPNRSPCEEGAGVGGKLSAIPQTTCTTGRPLAALLSTLTAHPYTSASSVSFSTSAGGPTRAIRPSASSRSRSHSSEARLRSWETSTTVVPCSRLTRRRSVTHSTW